MHSKITHHGTFGIGIFAGLFVSVITAAVVSAAEPGTQKPYDASVLAKAKTSLENAKLDAKLEDLSTTYHNAVNVIFNEHMRLYKDANRTAKDKGTIKVVTAPPSLEDTKNKECDKTGNNMNISTYCLFLRVDDLYETYHAVLKRRMDTAVAEAVNIVEGQQDASRFYNARKNWIEREFVSTKKTLDASLKAYSELLTQYPLHQEYEKTIGLLVKYYDHLIDIRKKVDTYPARFHDVTTTECK